MILPQTHIVALILMVFSMVCMGSWASIFKLDPKWRFELFYFDFALALMVAAMFLAFTVGSLGYDGFTLTDDMMHAGKRQWLFAFLGGILFNFANMFLLGAVSVGGMALAIPVAMGITLLMVVLINQVGKAMGNPVFFGVGCFLILAAIVTDGIAYSSAAIGRYRAAVDSAAKGRKPRGPNYIKGLLLAVISGLLMGALAPVLENATLPEIGLGPFALTLLMAAGILFSTFVFNMFFMNLPLEGEPLEVTDYLRAKPRMHIMGWVAGGVWCIGAVAARAVAAGPPEAQLSEPVLFWMAQGGTVIAALWGLLVWKEFAGARGGAKALAFAMPVLYAGGVALLALTMMAKAS